MKKSIVSLAVLLSLVGCANNGYPKYAKNYKYVDALKANGLTNADKINNASAEIVSFHRIVIEDETGYQSMYIIKSSEEATSFKTLLKDEQAFGDLDQIPYEQVNYFVSGTLPCSSSSYSYTFKGIYLKSNTVYAHLEYDDRNEIGVVVPMDMKYQYCHFTLSKSVSFTDAKIIISHYE